jgi:hypothetical protein
VPDRTSAGVIKTVELNIKKFQSGNKGAAGAHNCGEMEFGQVSDAEIQVHFSQLKRGWEEQRAESAKAAANSEIEMAKPGSELLRYQETLLLNRSGY